MCICFLSLQCSELCLLPLPWPLPPLAFIPLFLPFASSQQGALFMCYSWWFLWRPPGEDAELLTVKEALTSACSALLALKLAQARVQWGKPSLGRVAGFLVTVMRVKEMGFNSKLSPARRKGCSINSTVVCILHRFLSRFPSSRKAIPKLAWSQAQSKRYVFPLCFFFFFI